jgi:alpha-L-fucosidase
LFGIILVLLTAEDIRFTAKDSTLYVFVMGWPKKAAVVNALGIASPQARGRVRNVALPGYKGELRWKPHESFLRVEMPAEKISDIGVTLKVALA